MIKIRERLNQEGLTLIELLVTIAVLAIVAAIAIPVVTNVVNNTDERAVAQTQSDVNDFVAKYNKSGAYTYSDGVFTGYVDLNGDGQASTDEKIEELVVDTDKFSVDASASDAPADMASIDFDVTATDTFTVEAVGPFPSGWAILDNGVTITCDEVEVGDSATFEYQGQERTFTKRAKADITTTNAADSCTSGITSMSYMFWEDFDFNQDITHWDTSDVTTFSYAFARSAFNYDISHWDFGNVTTMDHMFYSNNDFNHAVQDWDVPNLSNVYRMFYGVWNCQTHKVHECQPPTVS